MRLEDHLGWEWKNGLGLSDSFPKPSASEVFDILALYKSDYYYYY